MNDAPVADRKPVRGALDDAAIERLLPSVPRWRVMRAAGQPPLLTRELAFSTFATALAFAGRVGALADELDHHPDLHVSWGKLGIDVWTHDVGGLSEADFVLAARIDRALADAVGVKSDA